MIVHFIPTRSPYDGLWHKALILAAGFDNISANKVGAQEHISEDDLRFVVESLRGIPLDSETVPEGWQEARVFIRTFDDGNSDQYSHVQDLKAAALSVRDRLVGKLNDALTLVMFGQPIQQSEAAEIRDALLKLKVIRDETARHCY